MPVVTMIGGPNGSGKSTLIQLLLQEGADLGYHFNADDIARTLVGDPRAVSLRAQEVVREQRAVALSQRLDYSWETVMSHPSHVEHLLEARNQGYHIRVIYIALATPYANMARVDQRVKAGGHSVPLDAIHRRYFGSLTNLSAAVVVSDEARIYDNSLATEPFRQLARWENARLTITLDPMPEWFAPARADFQSRGLLSTG